MKNRRFALTAFLIVAVLVMGIGFAALVDTLNITGDVTFNPAGAVIGEKAGAIKFSSAADDTVATPAAGEVGPVTVNASVLSDESASVQVIINGITDRTEAYVATAKFTVLYETTNTTLDPVYLYPAFTTEVDAANGFTVELLDSTGVAFADGTQLAPGAEIEITVKVTFDPTVNDAVINGTSAHIEHFIIELKAEDAPRG